MITDVLINGEKCARVKCPDDSTLDELIQSYARLYRISVFKVIVNGKPIRADKGYIPMLGIDTVDIHEIKRCY